MGQAARTVGPGHERAFNVLPRDVDFISLLIWLLIRK